MISPVAFFMNHPLDSCLVKSSTMTQFSATNDSKITALTWVIDSFEIGLCPKQIGLLTLMYWVHSHLLWGYN